MDNDEEVLQEDDEEIFEIPRPREESLEEQHERRLRQGIHEVRMPGRLESIPIGETLDSVHDSVTNAPRSMSGTDFAYTYSQEVSDEVGRNTCTVCRKVVRGVGNRVIHEGKILHLKCFAETYKNCDTCLKPAKITQLGTLDKKSVCRSCLKEYYKTCARCSLLCNRYEIIGKYCGECTEHTEAGRIENERQRQAIRTDWGYRTYSKLDTFYSKNPSSIITSKRAFSAEIECLAPSNRVMSLVAKSSPVELGIAHDGSVSRDDYDDAEQEDSFGIEFQTPKLGGDKGQQFIENLTGLLIENKFYTNSSCGLHIHLDGGKDFMKTGRECEALRRLWLFHWLFEDVILSFLPKERRKNTYCRVLKQSFHLDEILQANTGEKLQTLWYRAQDRAEMIDMKNQNRNGTRYRGFNLHSLLCNNHLEIRYHSGTINPQKILYWVVLHQAIMDKTSSGMSSLISNPQQILGEDLEDKTDMFFDSLKLDKKIEDYFRMRIEKFKVRSKVAESELAFNQ